ncbi:MAG: cupin-like domain-containing protein, partial [Sphingomonadales bacterium]|nr:cupin-like domain-containing protein [Sphingomonadales bacterium]
MENKNYSLDWVLDPISKEDFFANYWEKKPLLIERKDSAYFQDLLTSEQIEEMVSTLDPKRNEFDMVNADEQVKRNLFIDDDGRVNASGVFKLFDSGATMILQRLHRRHPELARFCAAMEAEFSHQFQTNIYFTPAGAKGFKVHYDTHDVFVMQLEGEKDWSIYNEAVELPISGQHFDRDKHELGAESMTFHLKAGDIVYIPRGWMHEARSLDSNSLHITVGALVYSWADYITDAIGAVCMSEPSLRNAIPPGFANNDFNPEQMKEIFEGHLQTIAEKSDFDKTHKHFKDLFLNSRRPLMTNQLRQLGEVDKLGLDSVLTPRDQLFYQLSQDDDDKDEA